MNPTASDLEQATRLDGEDGRYVACLSKDWEIWGPNGGYLATIALRAAGICAQIQRPASFYCHFLSSPAFDNVELNVSLLKRGRRAESLAVDMSQDGKPILQALVKTVADGPGYSHRHLQAPEVPAPETLKTYQQLRPKASPPNFSFWNNVERRPVDQSTAEEPSAPVLREWTRYRPTACFEDPFLDAARALILLDTFGFPAAYQRYRGWDYLAPNLDTSAWFHDFNSDCEWLLIDHECILANHGLMAVNGKVWDTNGVLLATGSAQLCCVPNRR
ncbi:MAG TPA: thioesterase family protein [Solirubrobacteraceae bacterium]|jgi:acyl-CoA thioesterase-2|nr:thioesterase family protein [Solirubrobacteraceae bacterium]